MFPVRLSRHSISLLAVLAMLHASVPAWAWPHSPSANVQVAPACDMSAMASDGAGGCFVAWSTYVDAVTNYDVFVQHYDAMGIPLWPTAVTACGAAAQQYVYALACDGQGGCIVSWADYRTVGTTSTDTYAQRLSAAGAPQWTANGVAVSAAPGVQITYDIAVGPSGVWFVWEDSRAFATTGYDIYCQLLTLAGVPVLTANGGMAVCALAGSQSNTDLAVDQNGSAVIAWMDQRSGVQDIYAQHIQANGTATWTANGVAVCSGAGVQNIPFVQVTPGYSATIAWTDYRGVDADVFAQRVSLSSGAPFWVANGVPVCSQVGAQYLKGCATDLAGNVVMTWLDARASATSSDVYAQKVDLTGTPLWISGGIAVRTGLTSASEPRIVSDQLGGTIFVWQEQRMDSGDIYAQRLNSSGSPVWTFGGVALCNASGWQMIPLACPGKPGAVIAEWLDGRAGTFGAYMQGVDPWGFLGAEPLLASVRDIPNDQGGQVKVSWYASPLDTDPLFQNITDYIVYRSVPTRLAAQLSRLSPAQGGALTLNGRRYLTVPNAAQDYFWEELAHVSPRHLSAYSYVAATEGDSIGGSNPRTVFMVMATGYYNSYWWVSKADSGYSVDNIPPAAPAPLTGQYALSGTALHWNRNAEGDLAGYRLYRGSSPSFAAGPASFVAEVPDTGYVDTVAAPYFYKLTAVDSHGNESPVASLMPSGTLAAGAAPPRAEFAAPAPNPLRSGRGATLRFALAAAGHVRLTVFDAQGRQVRVLAEGAREPGEHVIAFDGRDASARALAPGLYLARLIAPGLNVTRRLVIVE